MTLDEYLEVSVTERCAAMDYLAATNNTVVEAFEGLLNDLNDASTLLQTLAAFRSARQAISSVAADRARARAILAGGN